MKILASRPLATACLAALVAAVGMFFLPFLGKQIAIAVLALLLLLFILLGILTKRFVPMLTAGLCCALMLLTSIGSVWHFDLRARPLIRVADTGEVQTVQCIILEEVASGFGSSYYTARLTKLNGEELRARVTLECAYTAMLHAGDVVEMTATVRSMDAHYDREDLQYAVADGILAVLFSESREEMAVVGQDAIPLKMRFGVWRATLAARLLTLTGKQNGGLAIALFLGDRDYLDDSIKTAFRRTGVSHLLALSGMHITLLLGLMTSFTYRLAIPKQWRMLLLAVVAVLYLTLIGFRISAVRAVGMVLLMYAATAVGKAQDPLTMLSLVGFLIVLFAPTTVSDSGFWMSFAAVFGLVTVMPHFNEWLRNKHFSRKLYTVLCAIVASCVAVVSVSFLNWLFGGEIAPVGILLTVILTPFLGAVLIWTPLLLLMDLVPFLSASMFALPLRVFLNAMIEITFRTARLRNISFSVQIPYAGLLLFLMMAVLLLMLILPLRRKATLLIPPLVTALILGLYIPIRDAVIYRDQLKAVYSVVNSGSTLAVTDREGAVLIDTSAGNFSVMQAAANAVAEQGETEIEALVLTHYHRALVHSTERLAKRHLLRCVYVPLPQTDAEYAVLCAIRDRLTPLGCTVRCYGENESIPVLPSLSFCLADISYTKGSTHPISTYLLQTPTEVLTYTTPAVQKTEYLSTFRWVSERTNILILGAHGPTPKEMLTLPWEKMPLRLLLTDSKMLLSYLDVTPESLLGRIPHYTDISHYFFDIRK